MLYAVLAEEMCRASSEPTWTRQLYPIRSDRAELGLILVPLCPIFPRATNIVFLLFPLRVPVCFVPFCRRLVGTCLYELVCFGNFFPLGSFSLMFYPFLSFSWTRVTLFGTCFLICWCLWRTDHSCSLFAFGVSNIALSPTSTAFGSLIFSSSPKNGEIKTKKKEDGGHPLRESSRNLANSVGSASLDLFRRFLFVFSLVREAP